ncbi:CHAD domain-containing protein [Streptomyces sp. KR80]|uniref:CHAD domain-containing protein n=1 Tax=Streptomyces sp. KR80 TaxID=3457426 RepID=UPI003FD24503
MAKRNLDPAGGHGDPGPRETYERGEAHGAQRSAGAVGASGGGGARVLLEGLPDALTAHDVLAGHLHAQAAEFLRSLRLHRESGADAEEAVEAARQMRRSARRISSALHAFRPLTDPEWADQLRAELVWLSGTLALEHAYAASLARLRSALQRLSGADAGRYGAAGADAETLSRADIEWYEPYEAGPAVTLTGADPVGGEPDPAGAVSGEPDGAGPADPDADSADPGGAAPSTPAAALTVGAARAGALLDRQLTLARTRAHSAALQALGSSRFHAVADAVAVLASEAPLDPAAAEGPAAEMLEPLVEQMHRRLVEAVDGLPLYRAGHPYNAEALVHGLAATAAADAPPATEQQDAPWHQVRLLVRLRRYAQEVLDAAYPAEAADASLLSVRLRSTAQVLDRHHDAAEAAAAAAAAARTPRIAPATAYALGVLHADQRHDVEAARFAFGRLWQRMSVNA